MLGLDAIGAPHSNLVGGVGRYRPPRHRGESTIILAQRERARPAEVAVDRAGHCESRRLAIGHGSDLDQNRTARLVAMEADRQPGLVVPDRLFRLLFQPGYGTEAEAAQQAVHTAAAAGDDHRLQDLADILTHTTVKAAAAIGFQQIFQRMQIESDHYGESGQDENSGFAARPSK